MSRIVSNVTVALSLLLCLSTLALWVRSYWRVDGYLSDTTELLDEHSGLRQYRTLASNWGLLLFAARNRPISSAGFAEYLSTHGERRLVHEQARPNDQGVFPAGPGTVWNRLGFMYRSRPDAVQVIAPHWAVATVLALPPAMWGWRWRHLRRRRGLAAGLCPACGDDLRATPDRCPECGATPEPAARAGPDSL